MMTVPAASDEGRDGQPADNYWRGRVQLALRTASFELGSIESELTATKAIRANGSDDDEHDPDGIPLSSVLQQLQGQKKRALDQIQDARSALLALDQGRYGICVRCSMRIPPPRLEIKPTTTTCIRCAR